MQEVVKNLIHAEMYNSTRVFDIFCQMLWQRPLTHVTKKSAQANFRIGDFCSSCTQQFCPKQIVSFVWKSESGVLMVTSFFCHSMMFSVM